MAWIADSKPAEGMDCHLLCLYEGNSISKIQIQVTTYVFELSAGNCHRQIASLSSFIVTHNDRYAHECTDVVAVKNGGAPEYMYQDRKAWRCAFFMGKKYGSKGYPQRNAAHVR